MSESLSELVAVSPRFARSVALARDAGRTDALDGYILTPTGRDVLRRLTAALRNETHNRTWSLTGPYGSGKSAFALLVAQLLGGEETVRVRARKYLSEQDADACERLFGAGGSLPRKAGRLCPVLVTGSRQPLDKAIAAALASSLRTIAKLGRPPQIVEKLESAATQGASLGSTLPTLFAEADTYLERFGNEAAGFLLIVDELGKFLEFGASNPEQGDVFVLQDLAEYATRSKRPFLFLTILHQQLDHYAGHLNPGRRAEWAKVQGRFDDVAFEERSEQILRLLSQAVRHEGDETGLRALRKQAQAFAQEATGVRVGAMDAEEMRGCFAACYPLHPLTAAILGPLFRQLAQNERSLFAFLASSEPFGFQEFLREGRLKTGPYRADQLYDYVMASLGPGVFAQHRGKIWAEVSAALERLHDATPIQVQVAKTVGLIQALGGVVPASAGILQFALKGKATPEEVTAAVTALSERSVTVFRRHTGSYALWEGSDIDIEDRLEAARRSVERDQNLPTFLSRQLPPQAMIARRHYFQTGTLRYFDAIYCDRSVFQADLFNTNLSGGDGADGRVLYCLPRDADERNAIRKLIQEVDTPIVVALPGDLLDLRDLCHELQCLRWVAEHTPELEADRVARRELNSRLAFAEQNLRTHLDCVFSPGNPDCVWYWRGKPAKLGTRRDLNDLLSRACDEVFSSTPQWRNELINRRALSSSAAAARRNLIEAIFEHPEKENLGFEGNPPERSMYETLLRSSRLHRKQGGVLCFAAPDRHADEAVRNLWKAIDAFLDETESGRIPVSGLFATLRSMPFGLKDGILPVLLAAALAHYQTEVALYEEGSFVPKPTAAVFERLCRSPEKFDLQRFKIEGPRAEVFQQYAEMIGKTTAEPDLLTVVKPMVKLARDLPEYATKTNQIGQHARQVLKALREARQPDVLLFNDLPVACGNPPFEASGKTDPKQVASYFTQLRATFTELQQAYPKLLGTIEELILKAFELNPPLTKARPEIEHVAKLVLNVAVEAKLKAFLLRVSDDAMDNTMWLESIATLLAGKPPVHWDDQDAARFEVQLGASARTFGHYRVLAFEMEKTGHALLDGDKSMLLVSVTVPNRGEVERVVKVSPELAGEARDAREELRKVLESRKLLGQKETSAAILAELLRQILSEPGASSG